MTPSQQQHIKWLQWAILLSQRDLQTFGEKEWIKLETDLQEFIEGSGTYIDFVPFWIDSERVRAWFAHVQQNLKNHLVQLASIGEIHVYGGSKGQRTKRHSAMQFMVDGRAVLEGFEGEPYTLWLRTNQIEMQLYSALASHLVSSGIVVGQIRKCPSCRRIFLLKKKPRPDKNFHCSLTCSRREATRRYRAKKELLLKERERSHRRHVQKQKRKLGPNVKVVRRPRSH